MGQTCSVNTHEVFEVPFAQSATSNKSNSVAVVEHLQVEATAHFGVFLLEFGRFFRVLFRMTTQRTKKMLTLSTSSHSIFSYFDNRYAFFSTISDPFGRSK